MPRMGQRKGRRKKTVAKREAAGVRSSSRLWLGVVALAATVATVAAVVALRGGSEPPAPVPELDLSEMEPAVSRKVQEHIEAVREAPRSGAAWGRLGRVLHAHDLEREAAACYETAVELEPNELEWHYLLIHALRSVDADEALAQSQRALAVDRSYAPAHIIRGELSRGAG